jgi:PAS domain S-box-containing protein
MKPIAELEQHIDSIESHRDEILSNWVAFDEVSEVLSRHHIDPQYFIENFSSAILNYYIGVVRKEKALGDCPVMSKFLDYMKEKDVRAAELFLICTHFRKSMLDVLFDTGEINRALFDEVSYVFDLNFSGVLEQYVGRVYSAQREAKVHKRRFEEYNQAVDHSAMVYKLDIDGRIVAANPKTLEISEYSEDELIDLKRGLDEGAEEATYAQMWQQLHNGEIFHGVIRRVSKSHQEYFVETTVVPLRNLENVTEEYLGISYDVTELIRTRDAALEAERTKDQFLANMSHEIRTPLNAILGFVDVLRRRISDDENRGYLNVIHSSGENLLAIIGDILDFAKIKEGKLLINKHCFNPAEEFANVIELFTSRMMEKNIHYLSFIDPKLPLSIESDSVRLKQVLTNFLSNAVKFTPEAGRISVTIKIKDAHLVVSVKDSGCGIEQDALERVFHAFEQAEGSTTRKYGGTGLGLAICKYLATALGGDIEVESEIGKGSLFRLRVPVSMGKEQQHFTPTKVYVAPSNKVWMELLEHYLKEMDMQLLSEPSADAMHFYPSDERGEKAEPYVCVSPWVSEDIDTLSLPFTAKKIAACVEDIKTCVPQTQKSKVQYTGHVLLAEDNKANQLLMQLILEEYGLEHTIVSNGLEAVESFKTSQYDLILMDENMPVMNGVEAVQQIIAYEQEHGLKHTPIVAVTANAIKGDEEHFISQGMDGYVSKPVDNELLEAVFTRYLQHEGEGMSQLLDLPDYGAISADEMAAKIGLNVKHIPILVQSFVGESTSILEELQAAITNKDYEALANAAHSIKGSSGNLKFDAMYELAKEVELTAKDKKEDYPYQEAYDSLKKAIESISL